MTHDELLRLQADVCHLKSAVMILAMGTGQLNALIDPFENENGMELAHAGTVAGPTKDDDFLDALSVPRELMRATTRLVSAAHAPRDWRHLLHYLSSGNRVNPGAQMTEIKSYLPRGEEATQLALWSTH